MLRRFCEKTFDEIPQPQSVTNISQALRSHNAARNNNTGETRMNKKLLKHGCGNLDSVADTLIEPPVSKIIKVAAPQPDVGAKTKKLKHSRGKKNAKMKKLITNHHRNLDAATHTSTIYVPWLQHTLFSCRRPRQRGILRQPPHGNLQARGCKAPSHSFDNNPKADPSEWGKARNR